MHYVRLVSNRYWGGFVFPIFFFFLTPWVYPSFPPMFTYLRPRSYSGSESSMFIKWVTAGKINFDLNKYRSRNSVHWNVMGNHKTVKILYNFYKDLAILLYILKIIIMIIIIAPLKIIFLYILLLSEIVAPYQNVKYSFFESVQVYCTIFILAKYQVYKNKNTHTYKQCVEYLYGIRHVCVHMIFSENIFS